MHMGQRIEPKNQSAFWPQSDVFVAGKRFLSNQAIEVGAATGSAKYFFYIKDGGMTGIKRTI